MAQSSPPAEDPERPAPPEPERPGGWGRGRWLLCHLCCYGFAAQLRPGESFITPYLLSPEKNFTREQVTNEITPVLTYAYLAVLVPVFLLTDYVRYTPVLLLQGLSYAAAWLLLLLGRSVPHMQLMELCYALAMAARVAFSAYVFALAPPARYQRVAGCSRAAVLLGVFGSAVLGQLLLSAGRLSFGALGRVSLGCVALSLLLALFLRRPRRSLFFHPPPAPPAGAPAELAPMSPGPARPDGGRGRRLLARTLGELARGLRRPPLRLWSLWWVLSSAGYYLVVYYVHILWSLLQPAQDAAYNGAADAASTLLGAGTSFAAGFVKIPWARWAQLVIGAVTAVQAGLVFLMCSTRSVWVCYAAFVLFRGAYQFLVPIATSQIASSLTKEVCALVFGINTFLATALKTVITLIVSDKRGLGLPVDQQFLVYFAYLLALSAFYLAWALLGGLRRCPPGPHPPLPAAQELRSPVQEKAPDGGFPGPADSTWERSPPPPAKT